MTVDGSWRNQGGSFTGNGTVTLGGTGSGLEIRSNSQRFDNLTINAAGSWTMLDHLWVGGTFIQSAGTLDTASYVVHAGNVSKTAGTLTVGTGTVVVDASSDQIGLKSDTALNHLRIEGPKETRAASPT